MRRIFSWLVLLAVLLMSTMASAHGYAVRHGMSPATYQKEFNSFSKKGLRLTYVSGYSEGGRERYTAIWEKKNGPPMVARHGMSSARYQQEFNKWSKKGYRLVLVNGYGVGKKEKYAAIWEKKKGPRMVARHGLSSSGYQSEFNKWTKKGYRLTWVSGYAVGKKEKYAAIWEKKRGPKMVARHGMSSSRYQSEFNKWTKKGYVLKHVSGYPKGSSARYAAIWEKAGRSGIARHGLTGKNFQSEFENQWYTGYRPRVVSGYAVGRSARFAAIWDRGAFSDADTRHINSKVQKVMKDFDVPGLAIAITKDERLVYAKGFGHSDVRSGWLTSPKHRFRLASVSKPITATAIMKLVEKKKLKLSDKVFGKKGILGTKYGPKFSKYVEDVTVQHLLDHTGGPWDEVSVNWDLDHTSYIKKMLAGVKIKKKPGTEYAYSNFGYRVLGRVIEKVSGKSYNSYVRSMLKPTGAKGITLGKRSAQSLEVKYYGKEGRNPYAGKHWPMDAHGGLISSPIDLARFLVAVDRGKKKKDLISAASLDKMTKGSKANSGYGMGWAVNAQPNWWHNGTIPGTQTLIVRTSGGYTWAIVANTSYCCNIKDAPDLGGALDQLMWDIVGGVKSWPRYDLF